jgi:hypothetical protein
MKCNILYYLTFLLILLSCKKDKVEVSGTASAIFEGKILDFQSDAIEKDSFVAVSIAWYDQLKLKRVEFFISPIPFKIGSSTVYPLETKSPSAILFTGEDDLSLDDYQLLADSGSKITIDKIDQKKKRLSGTFDLTFVIDTSYKQKQDVYPDTIRLINGVFESRFK